MTPPSVCAQNWSDCPAGASSARASVQVSAPIAGLSANWSTVQVLFLLETTPYDGAYDWGEGDGGADKCADSAGYLCEESSLLRTFATHSGSIAESVAAAHAGVNVTFGLVDYFATHDVYDDGEGYQYHVDVGNFTAGSEFAAAVNGSLLIGPSNQGGLISPQMYLPDSDMFDSFLTSDSISALYLALFGGGLNWSIEAHHVLVQLGSSAPRDPHYPENYCISPRDTDFETSGCPPVTCEPNIHYGNLTSPDCVGWILPPTTNISASIADYARSAPPCARSIGGSCTIDSVDVWDTPTDSNSPGWPTDHGAGGGPGGANTTIDSDNILAAGCDIASATGGSWDGPHFASCNGTGGSLTYSNLSSDDVSLLSALTNISFGSTNLGALIGLPSVPLLQIVLSPEVELAITPNFTATCNATSVGTPCPQSPVVSMQSGRELLGWNWSPEASSNRLLTGDVWTVTFSLVAAPGASGSVPIYLCSAPGCGAQAARPSAGFGSGLTGQLGWDANAPPWNDSLPLTLLSVEGRPPFDLGIAASQWIGEAPLAVTLTPSVSGGVPPETVVLEFGDGTAGWGGGPSVHTYSAGTFLPSLTVLDSLGDIGHYSASLTVLAPLLAWMNADVTSGTAPVDVSFSAVAEAGEPPYVYAWSFGDGGTSSAPAPAHQYDKAGTWNVTLDVTDALGYHSGSTAQIVVEPVVPTILPPNPGNPNHGSSPRTSSSTRLDTYAFLAAAAVVGLAAVVVGIRLRRKRHRTRARGPSALR